MCYMDKGRPQVGVRELRQNLSQYLRRVAKGESLEVTDRGRAVAVLAPLPEASTALERLIASGRATRPIGSLSEYLKHNPPIGPVSTWASEALEELREERL